MLRLNPDEKIKLDEQDSINLNSNLTLPKTINELLTKSYVDCRWNDPSKIRNITHFDFTDKNHDNVRFNKMNSLPAVREHLTPKIYVGEAIRYSVDEPSLLRLDPNEKKLNDQDSKVPNSTLTSPKTIIELPTKAYVVRLHENRRKRRNLLSVFNDQDNEFDNIILSNLESVTVNRNPSSDTDLSCKKNVDDPIAEGRISSKSVSWSDGGVGRP